MDGLWRVVLIQGDINVLSKQHLAQPQVRRSIEWKISIMDLDLISLTCFYKNYSYEVAYKLSTESANENVFVCYLDNTKSPTKDESILKMNVQSAILGCSKIKGTFWIY